MKNLLQELLPFGAPDIERAEPTDMPELLELNNLCHEHDKWNLERLEQVFNYDLPVLVIRVENKIVALLIYLVCLDEVRIINLAVHPLFRNCHYGLSLMHNLITECKQHNWRYLLLDVRKSNYAAINLYTRLGFNILCVRKNFYYDSSVPEDAYFMQLELESTQNSSLANPEFTVELDERDNHDRHT